MDQSLSDNFIGISGNGDTHLASTLRIMLSLLKNNPDDFKIKLEVAAGIKQMYKFGEQMLKWESRDELNEQEIKEAIRKNWNNGSIDGQDLEEIWKSHRDSIPMIDKVGIKKTMDYLRKLVEENI